MKQKERQESWKCLAIFSDYNKTTHSARKLYQIVREITWL